MPDSLELKKWLHYAKNDLLVAKDLQLQKEYVYRAVLTHCQQAVEKYLKAFILHNNHQLVRTHDLIILNKLCADTDAAFLDYDNELAWLSAVYIESRYPDDFEDIDKKDAETALKIADRFEKFISEKFQE